MPQFLNDALLFLQYVKSIVESLFRALGPIGYLTLMVFNVTIVLAILRVVRFKENGR